MRKEWYILAIATTITASVIGCGKEPETAQDIETTEIAEIDDETPSQDQTTAKAAEKNTRASTEKNTTESKKSATTETKKTSSTETAKQAKATTEATTARQTVSTTAKQATSTTEATTARQQAQATTEATTARQAVSTTEATTARQQAQATTEVTTAKQAASTTEATTAKQAVSTTEATTEHQHNWVAVYKTVHHEEVGHTEESYEPWFEEPSYETHTLCNGCRYDFTANGEPAIAGNCPNACFAGTHGESVYVGTHWVYHTVKTYIVDQEAYDEQVIDHYECSCGAIK